jgi:hypothetical protein
VRNEMEKEVMQGKKMRADMKIIRKRRFPFAERWLNTSGRVLGKYIGIDKSQNR